MRGETDCINDAPSARSTPQPLPLQAGALRARAGAVQPPPMPGHARSGAGSYGALIKLVPSSDYLYGGGGCGGCGCCGCGNGGGGSGLPGRSAAHPWLSLEMNLYPPPPFQQARQDPECGTRIRNFGAAVQLKTENVCTLDTIWMTGMKTVHALMTKGVSKQHPRIIGVFSVSTNTHRAFWYFCRQS